MRRREGINDDAAAIKKLNRIKRRSSPMSIVVKNFDQLSRFAILSKEKKKFVKQNINKKTTFILPSIDGIVHKSIMGDNNLIGYRVPNNTIGPKLVSKIGYPITTTSVNRHGRKPMINPEEMIDEFGKESISNLLHIHGPEISKDFSIESSIINLSTDKLRNQQKLFQDTGGTHACGLFDKNGNLLFIGEDIGRHNAMDKLVGNVLSNSVDIFFQTFIIFSGRLSFELVHKARRAGISTLVSIGAPSSLAIDIAVEHGLTIVGFAKNKNMTVYTGRARIKNS